MKFKKSIITTFVTSAITTSLGVAANSSMPTKTFPIKSITELNVTNKTENIRHNVATASGMPNQYDSQLNKSTFEWAAKSIDRPNLGAIATEHQLSFAADFYLNKLTGKSTQKVKMSQPVLANVHDLGRGAKIAKYKQEVAGIEVFNREYNIMMNSQFNLVASSGYFSDSKLPGAVKDMSSAFGDPALAINKAFSAMGGDNTSIQLTAKKSSNKYQHFDVTNFTSDKAIIGEPRTKQVFFERKGKLIASHYVEIEVSALDTVESESHSYVISAQTGEILFKNNLKNHVDFNYRVYADENKKPWDSPHGNTVPAPQGADVYGYRTAAYLETPLVTLSHGPISTMDPWLADDASTTMGNNVEAYVDVIAPNGLSNGDYMAETTADNTFDYPYNPDLKEYAMANRKAAIVNLFYLNNYLHNDYYDHGFDELAGNGQNYNYERGGIEGDALKVEVQDHSGFNNANMSTPADGGSPRMQMYLFDVSNPINGVDQGVTISSHDDIGLLARVGAADFGPQTFDVSGDLVRLVDGVTPINNGCESATNDTELAGKIAIIDRGTCAFTDKVLHAQNAGAIAVLIANNIDGDVVNGMTGNDDSITIPALMISENNGAEIYALLNTNETVSISMFNNEVAKRFKGSSWDNGIVAHEWGHYISNRLVGNANGLISQQAGAMGEGFSDFHGLLLLTEENDASMMGNEQLSLPYSVTSYVGSFVNGIRPYPYSTNMETNPSTFEDVAKYPGLVHSPGSIFSNMLWESYVSMINSDRHTFAQANSLMKDYLVAGYKMMPIAPTFTEARDAILAAAYANDPADHALLLAAFAKRGMGLGAVSPSRYDTTFSGVLESNKTELSSFAVTGQALNANYEGLTSGYCSNDSILDKGETGTVSFTIQNRGSESYTDLVGKVEVVSDHDISLANEGMVNFASLNPTGSATSAPIELLLNDAIMADSIELKLTFPELEDDIADDFSFTTLVNYDFSDRELEGTSQKQTMDTLSALNDFKENVMIGGEQAVGTGQLGEWGGGDNYLWLNNNGFPSDVSYETKTVLVGFEGNFQITWYQDYNIEAEWDGGVVEISVNGDTWVDVTEIGGEFVAAGYTGTILENADSAIAGRPAFTGENRGWERVTFGESLNGNEVQFRFRITSDTAVSEDGWLIDEITFDNIATGIFSDMIPGDTNPCDNRVPFIAAVSEVDQSINEGGSVSLSIEASDPNNDVLTYSWEQTSGTEVTLTDGDTNAVTFSAPQVTSGSEMLTFTASVNDGTVAVTQSFSVTVNNVPEPTPVKKSSSGGSTGLLALLLLPLALLRRRK